MPSTTGIELASDSCLLVSVRPGPGGAADIRALRTVGPAEWPADDGARADLLRSIRLAERLPRRAVVVAWGFSDANAGLATAADLQFIEAAGFEITAILTPPQALAGVAAMRWRPGSIGATAWTALNTCDVAIAIVAGRELLFTRTFRWSFNPGLTETRAQLLQRYSLIAHLAPEIRHGIATASAARSLSVDRVVTCGNLPEMRSLTMPLIEELDLEVETLDSTDGLRPSGRVTAERVAEAAPALRLACAAVLTAGSRRGGFLDGVTLLEQEPSSTMRATAALVLIGALAWGAVSFRALWQPAHVRPIRVPQRSAAVRPPDPAANTDRGPVGPLLRGAEPQQPLGPGRASANQDRTPSSADAGNDSTPVSTALSVQPSRTSKPSSGAAAPAPRPLAPPSSLRTAPRPPPGGSTSTISVVPAQKTGPAAGVNEAIAAPMSARPPSAPNPLRDPLPEVNLILIDQDRRLAVVDGALVSAGDRVGRRTVARIDRDAVLLREPSGLVVRASIRSR